MWYDKMLWYHSWLTTFGISVAGTNTGGHWAAYSFLMWIFLWLMNYSRCTTEQRIHIVINEVFFFWFLCQSVTIGIVTSLHPSRLYISGVFHLMVKFFLSLAPVTRLYISRKIIKGSTYNGEKFWLGIVIWGVHGKRFQILVISSSSGDK